VTIILSYAKMYLIVLYLTDCYTVVSALALWVGILGMPNIRFENEQDRCACWGFTMNYLRFG